MANLTATAAVLYEIKKPLVIEEVELLEPGPHEVQVRWVANGVCHSDYHLMSGDSPHPLPVVLGHEAAGVVEKIGGWSSPCSPATTCARATSPRAASAATASTGPRRSAPCATSPARSCTTARSVS